MKRRKVIQVLVVVMVLVLFVSACAKKDEMDKASMYGSDGSNYYRTDTAVPAANYDLNQELPPQDASNGEGLTSTSSLSSDVSTVQPQDKIIRKFNLEVETQEFDSLITKVDTEIKALGGYVESSKISGNKYYGNEDARYGSIVARVPSDKVDEFVGKVDENSNIVNKEESSENVSLQYIDAQSRVDTLKIEQERLYAILEQEVNLENIITLESRLSDIRYELQNYESQLRFYDNQVSYSTVNLNIQEVEKLTLVTEVKQTVGTRIQNGFSNTIYELSEGFKDFFVWLVVNLPYLLIWAVIIAIITLIIRRALKKSKVKTVTPPPTPMMLFGANNVEHQSQGQSGPNQPGINQPGQTQPGQRNNDNNQPPQV